MAASAETGELKFSKNVDEFDFFGMRHSGEARNDFARVVSDKCWVIHIIKEQYENIVKKT
jgi:hypothetical protein